MVTSVAKNEARRRESTSMDGFCTAVLGWLSNLITFPQMTSFTVTSQFVSCSGNICGSACLNYFDIRWCSVTIVTGSAFSPPNRVPCPVPSLIIFALAFHAILRDKHKHVLEGKRPQQAKLLLSRLIFHTAWKNAGGCIQPWRRTQFQWMDWKVAI